MGQPVSLLRRALPILTVALLVSAAYDGWVYYSRYKEAREVERARAQAEAANARKTAALLGGDEFKILNFYASPGVIRRGEHATICYGVNRAKSVRIEPAVEQLDPVPSRCFPVSPRANTTYKLIAEDSAGHTATESFAIQVQ